MASNIINYLLEVVFQFFNDVLKQFAAQREILGVISIFCILLSVFLYYRKERKWGNWYEKIGRIIAIVLVFALTINATVFAAEPTTSTGKPSTSTKEDFTSYDDPILADLIEKMKLTPAQVEAVDNEIQQKLDDLGQTRMDSLAIAAAVVGIVVGVISIMGTSYDAGQYAARRCESELGLSRQFYQDNKFLIRAAMLPALGVGIWGGPFCLRFDAYFTS